MPSVKPTSAVRKKVRSEINGHKQTAETKRSRKQNKKQSDQNQEARKSSQKVRGSTTKRNRGSTVKKHDSTRIRGGAVSPNKKRRRADSDELAMALIRAAFENKQLLDQFVQRIADAVFDRLQATAGANAEHSTPERCIGNESKAVPNDVVLPLEDEIPDYEGPPESLGDPEALHTPSEPDEFDDIDDYVHGVNVTTVGKPRSERDHHPFKSSTDPFDSFSESEAIDDFVEDFE